MGYRSVLAIAIKKKAFEKHVGEAIKDFKTCDSIKQTKDTVTFYWDGVKWYEDYEDVKSVMGVLAKLEEEDYGFLRVGEDDEDIERLGDPYDFELYLSRSISLDYCGDDVTKEEFFAPNSIKFIKEDA